MKTFVSDIWHDLREKRLWPVAVVLLLGLIAVPVVLSKPAQEPSVAPVAAPAVKAPENKELAELTSVELEQSAPGKGSSLDTFDPADPFRPPTRVVERSKEPAAGSEAGPSDVEVAAGDSESVTIDEGSGGETGGPTTGDDGSGDEVQETVTTQYRYVIDVTFTANGRTRPLKGMERLDMLPDEANPLLLFLGAESNGANAVFLVDSTLQAAGEGRCKPSASKCAFLHIGAGSEHEFTNEAGDSYTLRIDEIRKVKVEPRASKASRRPRAGASVGTSRRFAPALISDLVSVSTTTTDGSTPEPDGR